MLHSVQKTNLGTTKQASRQRIKDKKQRTQLRCENLSVQQHTAFSVVGFQKKRFNSLPGPCHSLKLPERPATCLKPCGLSIVSSQTSSLVRWFLFAQFFRNVICYYSSAPPKRIKCTSLLGMDGWTLFRSYSKNKFKCPWACDSSSIHSLFSPSHFQGSFPLQF